jgi:hypothetical protein
MATRFLFVIHKHPILNVSFMKNEQLWGHECGQQYGHIRPMVICGHILTVCDAVGIACRNGKCSIFAQAQVVDGASDQLFAASGLAENQNGRIGGGNLFNLIEHVIDLVTMTDSVLVVVHQFDFRAQIRSLLPEKSYVCPDAVIDVKPEYKASKSSSFRKRITRLVLQLFFLKRLDRVHLYTYY